MKKEHIILIVVGVIFLCVIAKKGKVFTPVLKPGDKGNEVAGLQNAMTSLTGLQFKNVGAYDADTLNMVKYYMEDTPALIDQEKGYVCKDFATTLYKIQTKVKA